MEPVTKILRSSEIDRDVVTEKTARSVLCRIVTVWGAMTTAGSLLVNDTTTPDSGAGRESTTVPLVPSPAKSAARSNVIEKIVSGRGAGRGAGAGADGGAGTVAGGGAGTDDGLGAVTTGSLDVGWPPPQAPDPTAIAQVITMAAASART